MEHIGRFEGFHITGMSVPVYRLGDTKTREAFASRVFIFNRLLKIPPYRFAHQFLLDCLTDLDQMGLEAAHIVQQGSQIGYSTLVGLILVINLCIRHALGIVY